MKSKTLLFLSAALVALGPRPLAAQTRPAPPHHCRVLCAPTVSLMPGVVRTHLFGGPRVRTLATGEVQRLPSATNFEVIVAVAARTALPRLSAFGSVQWLPNASESRNPFTLYTASELGGAIHADAPTATVGFSGALLTPPESHGWLDVAANVGELFSQAAQPDARTAYTHKLDLDLVAHLHAFAWTPPATWVHRVSVYGILDYVATGLPHAGDEVPQGRVFVDAARPAALIVGLALPLTPSVR